jgi:hypothetical protein
VPLLSLVLSVLAVGCAGPPIPAPIQGEPVCADFELGASRAKMIGSLRLPVRLRILEGDEVLMKTVLLGRRSAGDPPSRSFIPDDNAEVTVEWAQCVNERAPTPVADEHAKQPSTPRLAPAESSAYECGEATVYKTDKLTTKKRDVASHSITFAPPPKPECWVSDAPPSPAPAPALDAGAPAAPAEALQEAKDAGEDAGGLSGDSGAPSADGRATGAAKDDKGKGDKSDKGKDAKGDKSDKGKEPPTK